MAWRIQWLPIHRRRRRRDRGVLPPPARSATVAPRPASPPPRAPPKPPLDDGIARRAYAALDLEGTGRLPRSVFCPITHVPMCDPLLAADGHSYERRAIVAWLRTHGTSPITGARLAHRLVTPNHALRGVIAELVDGDDAVGAAASSAEKDRVLKVAVAGGDQCLVRFVLRHGSRPVSSLNAALMTASGKGYHLVVQDLLKANADPNSANAKGLTALMFAAQNGHDLCLRDLLKAGAADTPRVSPRGLRWPSSHTHN